MLKDIFYLGFKVIKSSYVDNAIASKSIGLKFNFNSAELKNFDEKTRNEYNFYDYPVSIQLDGVNSDTDEVVFTSEIDINLRFRTKASDIITKDFFESNKWFFLNFAHNDGTESILHLLSKTDYSGLPLPNLRLEKEDS